MKDRWSALGLSLLSTLAALVSMPASLWEWDELLFARALHYLDVAAYSPHPPGFPVYIGVARFARLFVNSDTRALALTSALFAAGLGAGLFFTFRSIFRDRAVAAAASFLTILSPVVLVYAGTPRSDVAGLALGLIALALSLRGAISGRALMAAGIALGFAFGVRVTALPAVAPALLAAMVVQLRRGRWKPVVAAFLLAVLTTVACYAPVALDAGLPRYFATLKEYARYTSTTDSIAAQNENRILSHRLSRFLADPWGGQDKFQIVVALALLGLALAVFKDRRALGWLAISFAPIMIFTVMYATPLAGPLYAMPFLPLFTGLAAFFLVRGARILAQAVKRPRLVALGGMAVALLGIMAAGWTWPILSLRRAETSPPAQALRYLQDHADPKQAQIFYDRYFIPHVLYAFPGWKMKLWEGDSAPLYDLLDPDLDKQTIYSLATRPHLGQPGIHFAWTSGRVARRLRRLSLGRYFDVYLLDLKNIRNVLWLDGWFGQESDGRQSWRWMGHSGRVALFTPAETMTLRFRSAVLRPSTPETDAMTVLSLDGREIDRFTNHGREEERVLTVRTGLEEYWHILTVETSHSAIMRSSGHKEGRRELGLQCFGLEWTPAPGAALRSVEAAQYFKEGWYEPEPSWRWTGERAVLTLPAMRWDGRLDLVLRTARDPSGKRGRITFAAGGRTIDAFDPPRGVFNRTVRIPASWHRGKPVDLVLSIDKTVEKPGGRKLGICVFYAGWVPDSNL